MSKLSIQEPNYKTTRYYKGLPEYSWVTNNEEFCSQFENNMSTVAPNVIQTVWLYLTNSEYAGLQIIIIGRK